MKISNLVQAALLMVMSVLLLAPTTATAAVTLSIKEGPEKSVGKGEDGGKGSFSFVVDASGWKTFSYEKDDGKDALTFAGTYLSPKGHEAQGTLYGWIVEASHPSVVSDKLTIKFETDDKGLTQIEGSFQSQFGKTSLGALPHGVTGVVEQSGLFLVTNFYKSTGGVYTAATLPGGLGVSVLSTSPVPEPEEYAMMLLGFGMVGYQIKRQRKPVSGTAL